MMTLSSFLRSGFLYIAEAALWRGSWERYSENMQQIYRRIPMRKCDFSKVAKQLY